jgi:hypothetical protein
VVVSFPVGAQLIQEQSQFDDLFRCISNAHDALRELQAISQLYTDEEMSDPAWDAVYGIIRDTRTMSATLAGYKLMLRDAISTTR